VVYITSKTVRRNRFNLNLYEIPAGSGTGMVWDDQGHIVTNYHVAEYGDRYEVTLHDGSTWDGEIVGAAPGLDMAVLRINAPSTHLTPIPLGTSVDLRVGQDVLAIGNPFGLDQTLTTGIISALGRTITGRNGRELRDMIQTDAAINPGNSGGPLLDSAGRLIGMNTAIQSPSGASAGIGFAVPVDQIRTFIPQLIAFGKVQHPVMGISFLSDHIAARNRISGAVIERVIANSPAEDAGLRGLRADSRGIAYLGDVIIALNGTPVSSGKALTNLLEGYQAGDEVELTLRRDGETFKIELTLAEREEVYGE
jgi:S1-C subfamily serine protease